MVGDSPSIWVLPIGMSSVNWETAKGWVDQTCLPQQTSDPANLSSQVTNKKAHETSSQPICIQLVNSSLVMGYVSESKQLFPEKAHETHQTCEVWRKNWSPPNPGVHPRGSSRVLPGPPISQQTVAQWRCKNSEVRQGQHKVRAQRLVPQVPWWTGSL